MSLLRAAFGVTLRATPENPRYSLDSPELWEALGARRSASGVSVTWKSSFSVSAWRRGIEIRSGVAARICPPKVMRKKGDGYEQDFNHPAHRALRIFKGMTDFEFYRSRGENRLSRGNGYAFVERDEGAGPIQMIPLDPERVTRVREGGVDKYLYAPADKSFGARRLAFEDVWHTKTIGKDGLTGLSLLDSALDTLGAAIAMRTHGSALFRNFARLGVILEHPGNPGDVARANIVKDFNSVNAGVDNAFKAYLLEEGIKVSSAPSTMSARDAQLIEERQFETREIANFTGVPATWLNDPAMKTYASQEQDQQVFVDNTISQDLREMEASLEMVLLTEEERATESVRIVFDRSLLVQADVKSQAEADSKATAGVPWKSVNEIRRKQGLPPFKDPKFNEPIIPINLVRGVEPGSPADPTEEPPPEKKDEPPADPKPDDEAERAKRRLAEASPHARAAIDEAKGRAMHRLIDQARAAAKAPAKFMGWLEDVEASNRDVVARTLVASCDVGAAVFGVVSPRALLAEESGDVFRRFRAAMDRASCAKPDDLARAVAREIEPLE